MPIGSVHLVATAFWSAGQDDLLAPYVEKYLALVPDLDIGGMLPGMVYAKRLFPMFGVEAAFLERAEGVAAQATPVVRASVLERADQLRRMLRSRG